MFEKSLVGRPATPVIVLVVSAKDAIGIAPPANLRRTEKWKPVFRKDHAPAKT
jgi:hypothetical protein